MGDKPVTPLAMKAGGWRLLVTKNIRTKKHPGFGLALFVKLKDLFEIDGLLSVTWAII